MIQLKSCSYKGIEFLFTEMPTTGGNRVVAFNYPGSDKQSVEIQGKAPRNFSITAVIPHEDYYRKRDSLITVLEDGLAGVMIHPTFGELDNIINGQFSLDESISELGRATITIEFFTDDAKGVPVKSTILVSEVRALSDELNTQIGLDINETFNVSPTSQGNFLDSKSNFTNFIESIDLALRSAGEVVSQSSVLRSKIRGFAQNIITYINTPTLLGNQLSDAIIGIFDDISIAFETALPSTSNRSRTATTSNEIRQEQASADAENAYTVYKNLFTFGDSDLLINETTFSLVERNKNRTIIRSSIKTLALSYAYVEAAKVQFNITDDLQKVQKDLEAQYISVRESGEMSNTSLELLDRLRVVANQSLDESQVKARRVIEIETPTMPLSVLLYAYYGNTNLFRTISELNNIRGNQAVSGTIRILSA